MAGAQKSYKSIYAQGLFEGQVVIVTGGGTGIGLATARELAYLGATVAICSRKQENIDAGLEALRGYGPEPIGGIADVRDPDSCEAFVKQVVEQAGRVDVLVNNAGGQFPCPAEQLSSRGFEAVIRNNLIGLFSMTHAVANGAMIPAKRGRIVNVIADIYRGFPGMVHTGAARAGVDNMTKTLAVEWAHHGIRVNACAPGTIRSSGTTQYGESTLELSRQATPLKRLGTVEDVAAAALFLAARSGSYITGETLHVNGGMLMP